LPDDADQKEKDYVMLSDIFPTGWHATRLAALKPGESIVIFGAGPAGLMATLSARIQGASQVFVVDGEADRLALAKKLGAVTIDDKDRRYRGIRSARSGRRGQTRQEGSDRFRLRQVLVQRPENGHRSVQREGVQPPVMRADPA
jgi:threonine dehydrogenase-like Zn-dependent dehydrogenase